MAQTDKQSTNTPGTIILQWLTYAFWGWAVFFASLLAGNVFAHYLIANNDDSLSLYALAGVIIILPIALICDIYYSRVEPAKKLGIASVIMVIHAVLFALFSIGALVTIAFSIIQLLTISGDTSSNQVILYTSIIVSILYSVIFLRTLHPSQPSWLHKAFFGVIALAFGVLIVFGIVGPANGSLATRTDRLIDNNLSAVQYAIDGYVSTNSKLPANLDNVSLSGDAKKIVTDNLVQYITNSEPASSTQVYYQLCVDYAKASSNGGVYAYPTPIDSGVSGYSSYASTYSHPAGHYCYKLTSYLSSVGVPVIKD